MDPAKLKELGREEGVTPFGVVFEAGGSGSEPVNLRITYSLPQRRIRLIM